MSTELFLSLDGDSSEADIDTLLSGTASPEMATLAQGSSINGFDATDAPKVQCSPAVRRIAKENKVDLSAVRGTGPRNRITKEDILQYIKGRTRLLVLFLNLDCWFKMVYRSGIPQVLRRTWEPLRTMSNRASRPALILRPSSKLARKRTES